jgi:hypothetical protein
LRQRIFTASRDGDLRKVRNLQRLMLRCRSNALVAVRRVAQQNTGRHTAGVDGVVALWPEARSELAAAGGDAVSDQLVRTPIAVLDIEHEQLFLVSTETAVREGDSYHDEYGEEQWSSGRILKATKQVFIVPREFVLSLRSRAGTRVLAARTTPPVSARR